MLFANKLNRLKILAANTNNGAWYIIIIFRFEFLYYYLMIKLMANAQNISC